ncbi:reverse transcriptase domain-containing protein [Tanacetum coccineum]|uniref:Reverse transcriptase domain-containing protein n=1 Tax=Tanacetum coccineum TaxID=301880 RepID=A0ABQ5EWN5_9ASTR
MSTRSGPSPTTPTSAVRNTARQGKEISQGNLNGPASDAALREYCDKHYNQLLPILAEKMHQEKVQQEKLKAVKARLNFEEVSQHSESGTPSRRRDLKKRLGSRRIRSVSGSPEPRRGRSESPRKKDPERKTTFKRLEKGVFYRLGDKGKTISAYSSDSRRQSYHNSHRDTKSCYQNSRSRGTELAPEKHHNKKEHPHAGWKYYQKVKVVQEDTGSHDQKRKGQALRMIYPSHRRSPQDLSGGNKSETLAMPTWCHMFNSTLTGSARVWFDDLPQESVDSYDDLKEAFLANFCQQKKYINNPVEIHQIKQREGESTEDFVRRFKIESRDVKGALEVMRISGFMHGITNPELIKCLHDKIPKSVDEMIKITTSFLRGEVAACNQERKKSLPPWKQQESRHKQNFKKGGFKNQHTSERRQDTFTLFLKSSKEILALEKGKFKTPPPMTTPVEKRNNNKFCEFHGEVGHNTDECMHLKRKIEELLKNGKLSHVIKELKQNSGKDQPKINKKGETSNKDKALAILMVQPSSSPYNEIIGRPGVRKIQAVLSTAQGMLKFPVAGDWNKLCNLLQRNLDVFAWKPTDMTGAPRHIAEHQLNIREGCPPVRQKRRSQAAGRNQAIQKEVKKLVNASIMKKVHYHSWLSNPVMVKKHDGSWRMCVDFKYLNKAFLKDGYPLPEIDWKVESLYGFSCKCFLDAYKGHAEVEWKAGKPEQVLSQPRLKGFKSELHPNGKIGFGTGTCQQAFEKSLPSTPNYSDHRPTHKANFIVEHPEEGSPDTPMEVEEELLEPWILFTDGSSCADGSRAGLILTNPEGAEFTYALRFRFEATNNEAEYEALIAGLRTAEEMGIKNLQANVDSRLVANQVNGTY